MTARLAHEPKFTKKGLNIRSYLVSQEPDIVLEVSVPKPSNSDKSQQFIWLFDAKYRIKNDKNQNYIDNEDVTKTDLVPDDAINQMHRYRDALIQLTEINNHQSGRSKQKSRPVCGAFALYPGFFDQMTETNPYTAAIDEVGIGAFALLPSQSENYSCGHHWLWQFLQKQIGVNPNSDNTHGTGITYQVSDITEQLFVSDAARIPFYGMQQVLYPDLTLTVALSGQRGRPVGYFEAFEQGTAEWYHLPQNTFKAKFKFHIAQEIRYLAIAINSNQDTYTKQIDKVWPIISVSLLTRKRITAEQSGKASDSTELYYLFQLGKPLTLQTPVQRVPHRPLKNSIKLTTLQNLQRSSNFKHLMTVYHDAIENLD